MNKIDPNVKYNSSKMTLAHGPCPHPGCGSSDAYCEYEDGHTKCYSCGKYTPPEGAHVSDDGVSYQYLKVRGVSEAAFRKYHTLTKVDVEGEPIGLGFPFHGDGIKTKLLSPEAKPRYLVSGTKDFKDTPLFGIQFFEAGGPEVIITEGELDAISSWDMTGVPSLSLKSGSSAVASDIKQAYDYLVSFKKIILCFDNDQPGQEATKTAATILPFEKVVVATLTKHKDANAYLENGDLKDYLQAIRSAKKFVMDGVVSSWSAIEESLHEQPRTILASYPYKCLEVPLDGLGEGEVVLLSGLEGIGKTELLRAFEYHVLKTTPHTIGIIHLEESRQATVNGLVGYELEVPMKRSDQVVPIKERMEAFKNLTRTDDRTYIYTHYGSDNAEEILNIVRYLVAVCGCRMIFFDHVNIAVSGLQTEDERRTLDYITTQLAMMTERLGFNLVMISHLNDDGLTRGSRNTSKVAHVHVSMSRNTEHPNPVERNKIKLVIRKNRPTATTGPVEDLVYDNAKGVLKEWEPGLDDFLPNSDDSDSG